MSLTSFLKRMGQKHTLSVAIKKKVDAIHEDPDGRIGIAIDALRDLENTMGVTENMSAFADWLENNPGAKAWFTNLFRRDPEVVKKFFLNFLVNVNLKWLANIHDNADDAYGFSTPYTILMSPTMRCNLNCKGCYASQYSRQDELPTDEIDRIVTEGKELGTFFYTLLGGEPMVRWNDLWKIMRKHDDCLFQMFTNASLISDEVADQMLKLGNVYPVLSVNGWQDATDASRGDGAFQQIVDAADRLRERGLVFGNSFVFMRSNFEDLTQDAFYDFWIDRGSFFAWNFLYMPVGRDPNLELMPTPEQRREMGEFVRSLRERKPFFLMDFWNDAPAVGGCIAGGRRYIHITHEGDVEPCIFAHFATDNIHGKSLKQVLTSDFLTDIRMHQPHSDNLLTPCMIIDNPHVLREVVERHKAYSTDGNSQDLLTNHAGELDEYAQNVHACLDPVWARTFPKKHEEMQSEEGLHSGEVDRLTLARDPVIAEEVSVAYPFVDEYPWIAGKRPDTLVAGAAGHCRTRAGRAAKT